MIEAFEQQPNRRFTAEEFTALAYQAIERKHKEAVRRALNKLEPELGFWNAA